MKKIGLITLHDYNYGSALQCFASQEYLKQSGFDVKVLNQVAEYSLFKRYLKRLWDLFMLCLSHPSSTKKILSVFNSQRSGSLRITPESEKEIGRFNSAFINNTYYTAQGLCNLAKREDYLAFLSGSDQVWNGSRTDFYDFYFLRFAPTEKRVAWAASFGGNTIAPYNKGQYSKYLREYNYISVRESSAIEVVQELAEIKAVCLADPVTLFDGEQWRNLYKKNGKEQIRQAKYILVFFLDKPSELAVRAANILSQKTGNQIVTYGYRQNEIETHIDGGPWEFLSMIDNAECVLTDSFHTMVFSLLLHRDFYVFDRQYVHKQSQASRISDLLKAVDLSDRFEPSALSEDSPVFTKADEYFEQSRVAFNNYITRALDLQIQKSETKEKMCFVKDCPSQCCGCGACAEICPVNAISMIQDEMGHIYPQINTALCTECNACRKKCAFKVAQNGNQQKKGYVACGKDIDLIENSASGGIFATIAKRIIEQGGLVFGASLWIEKGKVRCEHIAIDNVEELYKIQGSKYAQSDTQKVFREIREFLKDGRLVLFGGTSCQVANLKSYLRRDFDNLITIDLICHGVPSLALVQDYLNYQSSKYNADVIDFKFRIREGRNRPYLTTTSTKDSRGQIQQHHVALRRSSFYRLFMGRSGYRPSCYNCPFASIDKPADITLGDYYFTKEEKIIQHFPSNELLSSVIVHTPKGQTVLINLTDAIQLLPHDINEFIGSHEQLNSPSQITIDGESLYAIYKEKGFKEVQKAVNKRNFEMFIPSSIKRIITFIK